MEGAIGKYLFMGSDGKRQSMSTAGARICWPDKEQQYWPIGTRIAVKDPSCTVMWTMDGTEPSQTNGTKVTKEDGAVWVWQDRSSPTVKARGYVDGKEVFYATATNAKYLYYKEIKEGEGINPGSPGLWKTDGYFTGDNPRPPYKEKDLIFAG
jgi:hypothetical protein